MRISPALSVRVALTVLLSLALGRSALAGTYTNFDVPGAVATISLGVNNSGDVVGFWLDETSVQGFLRQVNGTIAVINVSRGYETLPMAINGPGKIVGYYYASDSSIHGFLRNLAGEFTTINAPGAGWKAYQGTIPCSIN